MKTYICLNRQASRRRGRNVQAEEESLRLEASIANVVWEIWLPHPAAWIQPIRLWPMHIHTGHIRRVQDLPDPLHGWHAHRRMRQRRNWGIEAKELRESLHIRGMRIEWDGSKKILQLSQSEYIRKVLKRFNMDKWKPPLTPLPMLT